MNHDSNSEAGFALPPLRELGTDLLRVAGWERLLTLTLPFAWAGAYFAFASVGWWPAAVFSLVALSFVTYGSTSHDLVHRTLGLTRRTNDIFLCAIELLALRSGHAYQAAHLHHHLRYPNEDDVEGAASHGSCVSALIAGIPFHHRIWLWAVGHSRSARGWVWLEGVACIVLAGLAFGLLMVTPIFAVYVVLMLMGGWLTPFATSYLPHDPTGKDPLHQTRAFRGVFAGILGVGHLYHLEHHFYPGVPHRRWARLARRLDVHFARAGVKPVRFWF